MTVRMLLAALFLWAPVAAQQPVDPLSMYQRALCVVPLTGTGAWGDPKRPLYAPAQITPGSRDGIVAYTHVLSDDGQLALVEFVAYDRAAFKDLLADTNPKIKVFLKGKDKRDDIVAEFKKHKKDFDLDHFGVRVP